MNRWSVRLALVVACVLAFPFTSPAPLVYRPGEGWVYESVGGSKWVRLRAKDQLDVAQSTFDNKDYSTAFKAARRTARVWPLSDYAPKAQYLVGRCYEAGPGRTRLQGIPEAAREISQGRKLSGNP